MKDNNVSCPKCDGRLIKEIDEVGRVYYHCDKCDYQIHNNLAVSANKRCPKCNDFLILKKGRVGKFYSCHSCDYKEGK